MPTEKIANRLFFQRVLLIGLAISLPSFYVYYYFGAAAVVDGVVINPLLLTQAQTAAFWAVLLVHLGFVMSARSTRRSAFSFSPFGNRWLLAGALFSLFTHYHLTYTPALNAIFRTAEFPLEWWVVILPCLLPGFIVLELDKYLRNKWLGNSQEITPP
ncbi:cation-translocating P-type ATPase C-terminal domain-containing protein [Candidatus Venteria ishoeyi]|uniref:Calcium-transporting ATPase n=1 Tax=Candidatus Venteria ishoeyi TaxID=1899563 RepID=A0A1H6F6B7_9GAMM|nr:cation-translocating P-type ATPase C-terminal domain-containing protein [Candidatus Venteria ishoeyi]SEH05718.1 Calcium-transporting ATPase [Candidatus Venteria ishoeyi]